MAHSYEKVYSGLVDNFGKCSTWSRRFPCLVTWWPRGPFRLTFILAIPSVSRDLFISVREEKLFRVEGTPKEEEWEKMVDGGKGRNGCAWWFFPLSKGWKKSLNLLLLKLWLRVFFLSILRCVMHEVVCPYRIEKNKRLFVYMGRVEEMEFSVSLLSLCPFERWKINWITLFKL